MAIEIILLIIGVAIFLLLIKFLCFMSRAIVNFIFGLFFLFISNTLGITAIELNVINLLVCAALGIPGALILIALNLLGMY